MAVGGARVIPVVGRARFRLRVREWFDREAMLGPLFVTPALLLLLVLVAYPFCMRPSRRLIVMCDRELV